MTINLTDIGVNADILANLQAGNATPFGVQSEFTDWREAANELARESEEEVAERSLQLYNEVDPGRGRAMGGSTRDLAYKEIVQEPNAAAFKKKLESGTIPLYKVSESGQKVYLSTPAGVNLIDYMSKEEKAEYLSVLQQDRFKQKTLNEPRNVETGIGGQGAGYYNQVLEHDGGSPLTKALSNPIVNLAASFVPFGTLALTATKAINGQSIDLVDVLAATASGMNSYGASLADAGKAAEAAKYYKSSAVIRAASAAAAEDPLSIAANLLSSAVDYNTGRGLTSTGLTGEAQAIALQESMDIVNDQLVSTNPTVASTIQQTADGTYRLADGVINEVVVQGQRAASSLPGLSDLLAKTANSAAITAKLSSEVGINDARDTKSLKFTENQLDKLAEEYGKIIDDVGLDRFNSSDFSVGAYLAARGNPILADLGLATTTQKRFLENLGWSKPEAGEFTGMLSTSGVAPLTTTPETLRTVGNIERIDIASGNLIVDGTPIPIDDVVLNSGGRLEYTNPETGATMELTTQQFPGATTTTEVDLEEFLQNNSTTTTNADGGGGGGGGASSTPETTLEVPGTSSSTVDSSVDPMTVDVSTTGGGGSTAATGAAGGASTSASTAGSILADISTDTTQDESDVFISSSASGTSTASGSQGIEDNEGASGSGTATTSGGTDVGGGAAGGSTTSAGGTGGAGDGTGDGSGSGTGTGTGTGDGSGEGSGDGSGSGSGAGGGLGIGGAGGITTSMFSDYLYGFQRPQILEPTQMFAPYQAPAIQSLFRGIR